MLRITVLSMSVCIAASLAMKSYEGYKVLRLDVDTAEEVERLHQLNFHEIDFWHFPRDLMVSPFSMDYVVNYLNSNNIHYRFWMENVQTKIDDVTNRQRLYVDGFDYYVYHNYTEIMDWVDSIVETYPTLASSLSIGLSYEGRDLKMLKIGADTGKTKNAVWINSANHAREWITPATVMWMTNAFLSNYTTEADPNVTFLFEYYDIYILPVMNPDGYEYTWTHDRLWRKTRSLHPGDACYGTDGNRNFEYEWGGVGSTNDSCEISYGGPAPLSEIEVKSVVDFVTQQSLLQTFDLYIDYHAYAQLMMSPWAHTTNLPSTYGLMEQHMKIHTEAIHSAFGANYTYGTGSNIIYPVSGECVDWGYGDLGIPYIYTMELRDTGEYGFLLPEDQIYETSMENYKGLVAGLLHITA